jgi:lysyl-tRNA synthetase class I
MSEKPPISHHHHNIQKNNLQKTSCRIATGFTTSFLGDERTLREFIIGEELRKELSPANGNVTLYLINDDFDPLTDRQLRIAVNKDEKAISRHREFIGRPIAEIPDPAGCHESHARHFETLLMQRLAHLGIRPTVISTYRSYQEGRYRSSTDLVFEKYDQIKEILSKKFHPFTLRNLFRIKCLRCGRIDKTSIASVEYGTVSYRCEPCGKELKQPYRELVGKLSWKLDCAARWNIYDIDHETFSKAHLADLGSVHISAFLSREFFGGQVPKPKSYGHITLSPDLQGKLLDILPPKLFKSLFASNPNRDLIVSSTFLIEFFRQQTVLNGLDYISYIKSELPKKLLCVRDLMGEEAELVSYAQTFSKTIFHRDFRFRLPSEETLSQIPLTNIRSAMEVIGWSIGTRNESSKTHSLNGPHHENVFRSYLKSLHLDASIYKNLRMLFAQEEGPSIPTLLETLPVEFLSQTLQAARSFMEREEGRENGFEREVHFTDTDEEF